jgi:transcription elongation factor Elf1
MSKIDASYQSHITCPYCGWKNMNTRECALNDGDTDRVECGKCEKLFDIEVVCMVIREFASTKLDPPKEG